MSDLTALSTPTSINLTWSAPQEPNGVIISYQVTYRVTESNLVTTNTTDLSTTFSVSSLTPRTTVSSISVSAYTSIGRGEAAIVDDQTTSCELTILFVVVVDNQNSITAPPDLGPIFGGVLVFLISIVVAAVVLVIVVHQIKRYCTDCYNYCGSRR